MHSNLVLSVILLIIFSYLPILVSSFSSTKPSFNTNQQSSTSEPTTTSKVYWSQVGDRNQRNYIEMLQVSDKARTTFSGKSVLLTGATGGLGIQLAYQLVDCGVKDLILSGRQQDVLQTVADTCHDLLLTKGNTNNATTKTNIHIITCDLSNKQSVLELGQKAIDACEGNKIDVLINCGGVSSRSNFVDTKIEIDEKIMQINFFSGAALSKLIVPTMIKNNNDSTGGGKIIWISSVQGLVGIPSRTSYAASKFAVQGYCEALRAELAPSNITVHCVSPGYIRTNLSKSALTGDGTTHNKMDDTTAKGADPKDVAVTILNKVANGRNDFIVAATTSAKAAIWMRLLCPGILQKVLVKRFQKSQKEKED